MDATQFQADARAALDQARHNVEAFRALSAETSSGDVVRAFDRMLEPLNPFEGWIGLYSMVHPDQAMRDASEELERELAQFTSALSLDRGLYDQLARAVPEELAGEEERRVLEHGLRGFRRSGVDRDEATRAAVLKLREELVEVGQTFDRNIVTGGREFVVADGHAGLQGLPADFLASHPEREDGTVLLSTDPTDRIPMMSYAEREDVRRDYFRVSAQRAAPENLAVLTELAQKRHELARLLGYEHWADYVTEDKMTKSGAEARRFVERVLELVGPRALAERDELLEEKRKQTPAANSVGEWDRLHLTERVKRSRFGFDSQSVRPYFAYERVKQGVLSTSAALYGVRIERNEEVATWHPAVECYDVFEAEGGGGGEAPLVARFFLDMHPRDNKFKHAAMFPVQFGVRDEAGDTLAQACLVCNFPEPTADDPALLLHDQVTTFFHEVGHLLHHLFAGRQDFMSFSGISTERDFVEVPSQMYEEWAWDADVLRTFALHHETDEPIPASLVAELRRAEEYGKGLHVLTQMVYATMSLDLYDRDPSGLDPVALQDAARQRHLPLELEPDNLFIASFGHLNGYSAMYYTYMWSLVIAKDCFSAFDGDLMNGATANRYRRTVLDRGGSKDANDLVEDFLGRRYAFRAFEDWLQRGA